MTIHFQCPCGRPLAAAAGNAGRRARCPTCGATVQIPQSGGEGGAGDAGEVDRGARCCNDCGRSFPPGRLEVCRSGIGVHRRCTDCQRHRRRRSGAILYASLALLAGTAIVAVMWLAFFVDLSEREGKALRPVQMVLGAVAGFAVFRWQKHRVQGARVRLHEDERAPVLYLRSFQQDATDDKARFSRLLMGMSISSHEERLAEILDLVGPFVAVGRPGESLPTLGASRLYVPDASWQREVAQLMQRARCVVFRAGATPSLQWELQKAVRSLAPERILLWCPDGRKVWAAFRKWAGGSLQHPLPARPTHPFVAFDAAWRPQALREVDLPRYFERLGLVMDVGIIQRWRRRTTGLVLATAFLGLLAMPLALTMGPPAVVLRKAGE